MTILNCIIKKNVETKIANRNKKTIFAFFLIGDTFGRVHATLQPALSVSQSVSWLVGWSVTLCFFYDFISLTSLLLPKWSGDLKYGPSPPARNFGSRVSGLVLVFAVVVLLLLLFTKLKTTVKQDKSKAVSKKSNNHLSAFPRLL